MSVEDSQTRQLNSRTRSQFHDLLYGELISRENGHPNDKNYVLQDPCSAGDSLRITVHQDAIKDTPLTAGSEVTQLYFDDLGIVILDLNPQEDKR